MQTSDKQLTVEDKLDFLASEVELNASRISQNNTLITALTYALIDKEAITEMEMRAQVEIVVKRMQALEAQYLSQMGTGEDVQGILDEIEVG